MLYAMLNDVTTLYRLYTERRPNLAGIVSRHFAGFTLCDSVGYWEGSSELSCIVEVIVSDNDDSDDARYADILRLAEDIRATNKQTSVYVVSSVITLTDVREVTE